MQDQALTGVRISFGARTGPCALLRSVLKLEESEAVAAFVPNVENVE
ncbi:MAG: hypothetical protein SPI83_00055 [Rothia sp. (in: high G+C Gram-positive bacteria)]|nr:hypothetical protein [Rothia sp. (in: high G+C Gram-positive bacteria)]